MQPYLALITPLGGGGGVPTHPIAPGGPPPRPWGPINYPDQGLPGNQPYPDQGLPGYQPYPDQGLPGNQPYPDQGLPQPPGTPPLGIWGGRPPNYVDIGGPGPQPGRPGRPTHPIYYPPVIWDPSRPANPIVNPGDPDHPEGDRTPKIEWKTAWSPTTGWVVVGVPTGEHVTPSGER